MANDNIVDMNQRISAMKWWNSIPEEFRQNVCDDFSSVLVGENRDHRSLTGREIESIFEAWVVMMSEQEKLSEGVSEGSDLTLKPGGAAIKPKYLFEFIFYGDSVAGYIFIVHDDRQAALEMAKIKVEAEGYNKEDVRPSIGMDDENGIPRLRVHDDTPCHIYEVIYP